MIRAVIRIRRLRYTAEPLHVEEAIRDPYRVKVLRKVSKFLKYLFNALSNENLFFFFPLLRLLMAVPSEYMVIGSRRAKVKIAPPSLKTPHALNYMPCISTIWVDSLWLARSLFCHLSPPKIIVCFLLLLVLFLWKKTWLYFFDLKSILQLASHQNSKIHIFI